VNLWKRWVRSVAIWFLIVQVLPTHSHAMGIKNGNPIQSRSGFRELEDGSVPLLTPHDSDPYVRSKIVFSKELPVLPGQEIAPQIQYANVSVADPLNTCPLQSCPKDISTVVDQLVARIRESTSALKATRTERCVALQKHLDSSQLQLSDALKNQFLTSNTLGTRSTSQDMINQEVQQATALNQLLLTAADMVKGECIESMDDRVVIQRLTGEAITLGGLFLGGWPGIATAATAQILGNFPFFRDDLDKALGVFQKYDEVNERGSFLCWHRQMRKTACLLFASSRFSSIQGLDMTFSTGPGRTTLDSMKQIEEHSANELEDILLLREMKQNSQNIFAALENRVLKENEVFEVFHSFQSWCLRIPLGKFKSPELHPAEVRTALDSLQTQCNQLNHFRWPGRTITDFSNLLIIAYLDLLTLKSYQESLLKNTGTQLSRISSTLESMNYFNGLKSSLGSYYSFAGNQFRMNYKHLVDKLGALVAKKSFQSMMSQNFKIFNQRTSSGLHSASHLEVRRRAFQSILDLCKTLDPSLTCLSVENPENDLLVQEWKKNCVGRVSPLCRTTFNPEEQDFFMESDEYRVYYDSLCGN
jgi:hypothetical protein